MAARALILAAIVTAGVAIQATAQGPSPYLWDLPPGLPAPAVPADNPMSVAKVELGRHLFHDTRLSGNGRQSCASCHEQARAFTDGRPRSIGSTGARHPRGSMSLANVAYADALNWATAHVTALEAQARTPMFGTTPVELGLTEGGPWLETITNDPRYRALFAAAFPADQAPATVENVLKALATFQRAIVSFRSPFDRYHFNRDDSAISEAAKRGEVLFHSRPLSCFTCHGGVHFSGAMGRSPRSMAGGFHNTGLYNLSGATSYPADNTGLHAVTQAPGDVGKFKAPTLRNIAVTAPYMHDGSAATLDEVIDHYAAGGRAIVAGPNAGVGRENPNKSPAIRGFLLTPEQRSDLRAFLASLTDDALLSDSRFASPWPRER